MPRRRRLQKGYLPILRWTLEALVVTLGLAVLVLVGTIAIAPLMKTNFLGDSGQNTFTVTQDIGAGAEPRGRGRRGAAGRGGAPRHRGHRDRADLDRLERLGARATPSRAAAAASPTRSRPTPTPTRSRSAKTCRRPSPTSTTSARSRSPPRAAGSARATSRSTSPRPTRRPAGGDRRRRRRASTAADGIGQVSSNLSASLPYIAVDGRP